MVKLLVCVALAAVVIAPVAHATLLESAKLETYAQQVRGSHVTVYCENDQGEWNDNQPPTALAVTFYSRQSTILSPAECANLNAAPNSDTYDAAIYIFTHELMHSAGITSEWQAECMNLFLFRYELRAHLGYTAEQAQVAWNRGLAAHNQMPFTYTAGCTPNPTDVVSQANGLSR